MSMTALPTHGLAKRPRIAAVVVSFNPEKEDFEHLLAELSLQVDHVVVIDNGSAAASSVSQRDLALRRGAQYHRLPVNGGIGAGQNTGIALALEQGADYVLLMDHDSVPTERMVETLLCVDEILRSQGVNVGVVGPRTVDRRSGRSNFFVRMHRARVCRIQGGSETEAVECDFLISSGSLIRVDVLAEVGLMNEGYFIDHVDTEWCFRAKALGYRCFGVPAAILRHTLGDHISRVWLGRWREVAVHSPVRNYYVCRNTVLMVRHTAMPRAWQLSQLIRLLRFMVFFSVAVSPRGARLRLMLAGVRDGLADRDGPLARTDML